MSTNPSYVSSSKENALPVSVNLPPMQSVSQHKQREAAARQQIQQQQHQSAPPMPARSAAQQIQQPSTRPPRPSGAAPATAAAPSAPIGSAAASSAGVSVSAASSVVDPSLVDEMGALAAALHAKLADLDSKFLKHTHKAIAGTMECMAAAQQRHADEQIRCMRDECERQVSQERAAHQAAEQQWAEQMESLESSCNARVAAAESAAQVVQRRLDESQAALLDAQTKYAALQGKWKELKRILQAKQAPQNAVALATAPSTLPSPPVAAAAAPASPAPHAVATAATLPAPTSVVPVVDPRAISALLASQQEDQQQALYQQQHQAQLQSATRSPSVTAPAVAVSAAPSSSRKSPPPPPLPLPQATEDPFATPPSPPASLPAGLPDAMPPLEQSTQQQQQQQQQDRGRPLFGAVQPRASSPSLQQAMSAAAVSPSPPPAAAAIAATVAPAAAASSASAHSWKSKKIYSAVDLNHSRAPVAPTLPGQAAEARAVAPLVDAAPIAARAVSPSPPAPAPAPAAAAVALASPLPSVTAASVAAPPVPVAAAFHAQRAPAEVPLLVEEDDCVVIDATDGPVTPSFRVRAAARPAATRSPVTHHSTSPSSRADGFAVPAPMAPKAWQPAAAAARKSLATPISASATSAAGHVSAGANGDARLQKKRQRAAVEVAQGNDDKLLPSSRPHRSLPSMITDPTRSSPSKKARSAVPAHPHSHTVPAASTATAAASPPIVAGAASPSARPSVCLSELLAGGGGNPSALSRKHPSSASVAAPNASAFLSPPPTAARPSPPPTSSSGTAGASTGGGAAAASPSIAPYISTERSREVRDALPGYSCRECDAFYAAVGMDRRGEDGRTCEHAASRHRYQFPPALTPESYWDVSSPSSTKAYEDEAPAGRNGAANGRGATAAATAAVSGSGRTSASHAIHSLAPSAHPHPHQPQPTPPHQSPRTAPASALAVTAAASSYVAHARAAVMEYEPTSQELEMERQMNFSLDR